MLQQLFWEEFCSLGSQDGISSAVLSRKCSNLESMSVIQCLLYPNEGTEAHEKVLEAKATKSRLPVGNCSSTPWHVSPCQIQPCLFDFCHDHASLADERY